MQQPVHSPDRSLVRLRWVGLLGSLLLAAGAAGAGVLPRPDPMADLPVLRLARTHPGVTVCIALAVIGMALLVGAWWRIGRSGELTPRWVVVTAAWWSLPLAVAPPLFSRDVYSYAAQGDLLLHHLDPYEVGPAALPSSWLGSVSVTWAETPAPYGPLYLQLAQLAVALAGGLLPVAILLLRLVSLAGVLLTAAYLPRLASACGIAPARALWLGVASPLVLAHFVSGAHNDALMVGFVIAGLAYAAERKGVLAAILIALAATVKAPALVALPFVALLWSVRMPGRWPVVKAGALTAAVATTAFAAVTVATGLGVGWAGAAAGTPGITIQWTSIPTGFGIAAGWVATAVGRPDLTQAGLDIARAIGTVVMLGLLGGIFWRAWRRLSDVRLVVAAIGWAMLAVVLLAPAFHPWYLPWAVAPLAAATVDRRVFTGLAVASGALCFLVLPDGFNLARATVVPGVVFDIVITGVLIAFGARKLRSVLAERKAAVAEHKPAPGGATETAVVSGR